MVYEDWKVKEKKWDDADRVLCLSRCLLANHQQGVLDQVSDRVYIDEVQDLTGGELSLVAHAAGGSTDGFFFGGDSAQVWPDPSHRFLIIF